MMAFVIVVALAGNVLQSDAYDGTPTFAKTPSFEEWSAAFNKAVVPERRKTFAANLAMITKHNSAHDRGTTLFRMGLNAFADLTADEWRAKLSNSATNDPRRTHDSAVAVALPPINVDSVDWRTKGAVTPIVNQGTCGSCWAVSAVGAIEGAYAIATGALRSLSVQQTIDCSRNCAEDACGCEGGLPSAAFKYVVRNGGLDTSDDYNYTAISYPCDTVEAKRVAAKIDGYVAVPSYNESQLRAAVTQQPVSVGIDATGSFQFYKSGILDNSTAADHGDDDCDDIHCLNHAVLVVGFGNDNGTDYWLVKNSWGTAWGEDGYVRMLRGYSNVVQNNGLRGIAVLPVYPTVAKGPAVPLPPPTPPHPSPRPKTWCGNCGENCESECRGVGLKCADQHGSPVTCDCMDPTQPCHTDKANWLN